MTVIRDAIILVVLILLALTVRISPRPEPVTIVPEARAESARPAAEPGASSDGVQPSSEPDFEELLEITVPALRSVAPFLEDPSCSAGEDAAGDEVRARVWIEWTRDRPHGDAGESCPEDCARTPEAPAAGAAC